VSKLGKEGRIGWIDDHDETKCFPCNSANWRDDLADLGDGVFLGGRSPALCPYNLQRLGITHVLQVMDYYGRPDQFKGFQYFVVHVRDWSSEAESLAANWDEAFEFIEQAMGENGKVLVHCFAGKVVAFSWLLYFRLSPDLRILVSLYSSLNRISGAHASISIHSFFSATRGQSSPEDEKGAE
jgi:hypothetical protein